jgi:hypothetical protein
MPLQLFFTAVELSLPRVSVTLPFGDTSHRWGQAKAYLPPGMVTVYVLTSPPAVS